MFPRLNRHAISALLVAAASTACGGTTVTELSGPSVARCQTGFATPPPTVPAEGGTVSLTVSAERECTWSARGDSGWIQVSPTSGQGEAAIRVTASANPDARRRSADVVVNDQRLSVSQEPAPCVFSLGARSGSVAAAGGRLSVDLSTLDSCEWTASSPVPWAQLSASNGTGRGTLEVVVAPNAGAARSAQLSIGGEGFTVTQAAFTSAPTPPAPAPPTPAPPAPAPPTPAPPAPAPPSPTPPPPTPEPPPPANCSYTIDPAIRTVDSRRRDGSIRVRTSDRCRWTAGSNVDWISITDGDSGSGDGEVRYRIDRNESLLPRIGTLSVAGRLFYVFQGGASGGNDDEDDDD